MDIDNTFSVVCLSSLFSPWIRIATSVIPLTSNFNPSHLSFFPGKIFESDHGTTRDTGRKITDRRSTLRFYVNYDECCLLYRNLLLVTVSSPIRGIVRRNRNDRLSNNEVTAISFSWNIANSRSIDEFVVSFTSPCFFFHCSIIIIAIFKSIFLFLLKNLNIRWIRRIISCTDLSRKLSTTKL